jgi:hypothetical protein
MDDLIKDLDEKDAEELEDVNSKAIHEELSKPVAFNKDEELVNKYAVTLDSRPEPQPKPMIQETHHH